MHAICIGENVAARGGEARHWKGREGNGMNGMEWNGMEWQCNLLAVDAERLLVVAVLVDADARVLLALVALGARGLNPLRVRIHHASEPSEQLVDR